MAEDTSKSKVVAFVYDNATTGHDAPVSFTVIPGIWTPGEAMLPEAFGMTVEQMRAAIREYNLPLREERTAAKDAYAEADRGWNHLPVEETSLAQPAKPSDAVIETADGPIPAPAPAGAHRPLLGLAAAHQARNTALARGESLEAAADAARAAGEGWGDALAEQTAQRAADLQTAEEQETAALQSGDLVETEEQA